MFVDWSTPRDSMLAARLITQPTTVCHSCCVRAGECCAAAKGGSEGSSSSSRTAGECVLRGWSVLCAEAQAVVVWTMHGRQLQPKLTEHQPKFARPLLTNLLCVVGRVACSRQQQQQVDASRVKRKSITVPPAQVREGGRQQRGAEVGVGMGGG